MEIDYGNLYNNNKIVRDKRLDLDQENKRKSVIASFLITCINNISTEMILKISIH